MAAPARGGMLLMVLERFRACFRPACPSIKLRVLGRLGWNSYGTEGAQPVANVRRSGSAKTA
jgi:hypothetical protein